MPDVILEAWKGAGQAARIFFPGTMACMAICAAGNGFLEYRAFLHHTIQPDLWVTAQIPPEKQAAFYADWSAHSASYFVGFAGGIVLIVWVLVRRYQAGVKRALAQRPDPRF